LARRTRVGSEQDAVDVVHLGGTTVARFTTPAIPNPPSSKYRQLCHPAGERTLDQDPFALLALRQGIDAPSVGTAAVARESESGSRCAGAREFAADNSRELGDNLLMTHTVRIEAETTLEFQARGKCPLTLGAADALLVVMMRRLMPS